MMIVMTRDARHERRGTQRSVLAEGERPGDQRRRLTIGMPIYNGERFLEHTVGSLLAQDYEDFVLLISDNGSTDSTPEICEALATRDDRVCIIRHATNRGAAFNWNFVYSQLDSEYFKWASDNDYYAPQFLSRCVEALDQNPDWVLCSTRTVIVSDEGAESEICETDEPLLDEAPSRRFLRVHNHTGLNNAQSGVIRLAALRETRGERYYPHGDWVLMAELASRGKFGMVDESLFYRRMGAAGSSVARFAESGALHSFISASPSRADGLRFWRERLDFLRAAISAPASMAERVIMLRALLGHMWWKRRVLSGELKRALRRVFGVRSVPTR